MDFDRFVERLKMLERVRNDFLEAVREAYWEKYDEAQLRHETAFIRKIKDGITDRTGMDDKHIAERIDVVPATLCTWQKYGKARPKNLQRLVDLAKIHGVEMPELESLSERYKPALIGAMKCLLEQVGETTDCDLSSEVFEWLWAAPFEDWSLGPGDEDQLNGIYQDWLAEFPGTSDPCSPSDLFYRWVPAYIACREVFNPEEIEEDR